MSDTPTIQNTTTNNIVKPLVAGLSGYLLNKYLLKVDNETQNMIFGAEIAFGVLSSNAASQFLPVSSFIPIQNNFVSGKMIESRIVEVGTTMLSAYTIDFVSNSYTIPSYDIPRKLGIILLADVIGEMSYDAVNNMKFSFLS